MRKKVLSLLTLVAVLFLVGCQNPITKYQLNKGEDNITKALKNTVAAKKGVFGYEVKGDIINPDDEGEYVTLAVKVDGYMNSEDAKNPQSDINIEYSIKISNELVEEEPEEITSLFGNVEQIGLKLHVIIKDGSYYIKPAIQKNNEEYIDLLSEGKYFYLDKETLDGFVKNIQKVLDQALQGSDFKLDLNKISDESQKLMDEISSEMQVKVAATVDTITKEMKVTDKKDGEYSVELDREMVVTNMMNLVKDIYNVFLAKGESYLNTLLGTIITDNIMQQADLEDAKEELDKGLKEVEDGINKYVTNDPLVMKVTLKDSKEIKKASMPIYIDVKSDSDFKADLNFAFSATDLGKNKDINTPDSSDLLAVKDIINAAGKGKLTGLLNGEFIKAYSIPEEALQSIDQAAAEAYEETEGFSFWKILELLDTTGNIDDLNVYRLPYTGGGSSKLNQINSYEELIKNFDSYKMYLPAGVTVEMIQELQKSGIDFKTVLQQYETMQKQLNKT